jgi:hypothetical protein
MNYVHYLRCRQQALLKGEAVPPAPSTSLRNETKKALFALVRDARLLAYLEQLENVPTSAS